MCLNTVIQTLIMLLDFQIAFKKNMFVFPLCHCVEVVLNAELLTSMFKLFCFVGCAGLGARPHKISVVMGTRGGHVGSVIRRL